MFNFLKLKAHTTASATAPVAPHGMVTEVAPKRIRGWAVGRSSDGTPLEVVVKAGEIELGRARATSELSQEQFEESEALESAKAFEIIWPEPRSHLTLEVVFAESGIPLLGSPRHLGAAPWNPPDSDFADLSEIPDDDVVPPLDRTECDESALTEDQLLWRRQGYLILDNFMPSDLVESYAEARWRLLPKVHGWNSAVPYMHVPEALALCTYAPLAAKLEELISEPMGLHLNLTSWVSTQRNWHQDDYLNPETLNSYYAAVWIALDDIHPDSGPFEYVPGSHRWPVMRREKIRSLMPPYLRHGGWPKYSEPLVVAACEKEIARRRAETRQFIAKKGDVLIWHGRLLHRGTAPRNPTLQRRAMIAHYSAIDRRPRFPAAKQADGGGWYFPVNQQLF
ncbi:phytanoyl-CoA dioxygenase family protein [Limibacillus sp. MBR-115]|jgi:hypothetical protein|uniref:phytanoyl-CoA dioxygenase family protein n=1 Tax=Limibacillus sp. MBR-115 TaxID=3156465 RepID=UPI0033935EE6